MMFSKKTPLFVTAIFFGLVLSTSALACSTDGWDSESGAIAVGSPYGAVAPDQNNVWRFEELCALTATGTGYVQTDSPSHGEVTNRLYVLPQFSGAGTTDFLVGYDNGLSEIFSVAHDGSNFVFTTTGGSDSSPALAGWNLIEYHWDGTTFEYWVNADATSDSPTGSFAGGGAATLETVRVGLPNGFDGTMSGSANFDSFEMHNTTAIGPLLNCDANGDTNINVLDAAAIFDEFFQRGLAAGTPDCNYSGGALNILDASAVFDIIFAR